MGFGCVCGGEVPGNGSLPRIKCAYQKLYKDAIWLGLFQFFKDVFLQLQYYFILLRSVCVGGCWLILLPMWLRCIRSRLPSLTEHKVISFSGKWGTVLAY